MPIKASTIQQGQREEAALRRCAAAAGAKVVPRAREAAVLLSWMMRQNAQFAAALLHPLGHARRPEVGGLVLGDACLLPFPGHLVQGGRLGGRLHGEVLDKGARRLRLRMAAPWPASGTVLQLLPAS